MPCFLVRWKVFVNFCLVELEQSLEDQQAASKAQAEDEDDYNELSKRYQDLILEKATMEQKLENLHTQLRHVSQFGPQVDSSSAGGSGDALTPGAYPGHRRNVSDVSMTVSMGPDEVRPSFECSVGVSDGLSLLFFALSLISCLAVVYCKSLFSLARANKNNYKLFWTRLGFLLFVGVIFIRWKNSTNGVGFHTYLSSSRKQSSFSLIKC